MSLPTDAAVRLYVEDADVYVAHLVATALLVWLAVAVAVGMLVGAAAALGSPDRR